MLHLIDTFVSDIQTWLYIDVVHPLLFRFNLMDYDEDTYDALYWVIVGALQIVAMFVLLRPLEALRPVERWKDRGAVRVYVIYTLIAKLGIYSLFFFFALQPLFDKVQGWLRLHGVANLNLDTLWPGVTSQPIVAFAVYLVVLDFAGYWYHRWQHKFGVWWELHAVHHSQRQMSLWCDDRNHLIDDVLQSCFFAVIALVIGVSPSQFVVLTALTNFVQSIQHINARLPFVRFGELLLVSPAFHRRHHAVGYGHEGTKYGCNFGVLFPWWDMMFGTASWNRTVEPTGIREQIEGRSYGDGFVAQQALAFVRIYRRLVPAKRGTTSSA